MHLIISQLKRWSDVYRYLRHNLKGRNSDPLKHKMDNAKRQGQTVAKEQTMKALSFSCKSAGPQTVNNTARPYCWQLSQANVKLPSDSIMTCNNTLCTLNTSTLLTSNSVSLAVSVHQSSSGNTRNKTHGRRKGNIHPSRFHFVNCCGVGTADSSED